MATILESKSLYYNDVNLIAQHTNLKSRKEITDIKERILVSPMASIIGEKFAIEAINNGIKVCLHRFCSIYDQINLLSKLPIDVWCCIGLNDWDRYDELYKYGVRNFIIDVANGYQQNVIDFARSLSIDINLMIGNVHSSDIFVFYKNDIPNLDRLHVRVGIGQGSVCLTKDMTGYTRGQITELMECSEFIKDYNYPIKIVADGGIKDPSYASKAFGCGSDLIMLGGYFSHAEEAQNIIDGHYKYWGGASKHQQGLIHGKAKRHSEGTVLELDKNKIKPLKELISDLEGGIQSAVSYSGYNNLKQFIGNGIFEVKK